MNWPHDDTQSLIAFYGTPPNVDLATIIPPWKMVLAWDTAHAVQHVSIHVKCADSLTRVFEAIWGQYGKDQARIENETGLHLYGGTYNYRPIRGSTRLSCHAFGAAIDLNPDANPMNSRHITHMPVPVITAFKAEGWFWGGDFHTRQDPMHFQAAHE